MTSIPSTTVKSSATIGFGATSVTCMLIFGCQSLTSNSPACTFYPHSVLVQGQRYKLKAEDLDERYYGVRTALWTYWQHKRRGRVPMDKLRTHFQFKGYSGFFREMLWHLLTAEEYEYLNSMRRKGMLHKVKMQFKGPKGPKPPKGSKKK
jgi:hypothetical protein